MNPVYSFLDLQSSSGTMSKEKKSKKKGKVGVLNTEFEMDENVLTAKEKVRLVEHRFS